MKKVISMIIALVICISLCSTSFADDRKEFDENEITLTSNYSIQEKRYIEQKIQMEKVNNYIADITRDVGEAYVEWGDTKYQTVTGCPGNQPANGTYFSTAGGSFGYTPDGGPAQSVSVNLGLGYGIVNMSITLGQLSSGSISYLFNVPSSMLPGYFKLKVSKTVEIKPYTVYYRTGEGAPWEESLRSYITNLYDVTHSIEKI